MSETFFENPLYVYVALALSEVVLVALFFERRSRRAACLLLVPAALAGVVALVAHLVRTDREKIIAAARDIADAVEAGQFDRIAAHLDDDFSASLDGRTVTKAQTVAVCTTVVKRWDITAVTFHNVTVEVTGDRAKMHLTTFISFKAAGPRRTGVIWDVRWIRRSDKWLLLEAEEPTPGFEL